MREWGPPGGSPLVLWPGLNATAGRHFDEAGPLLAERFSLRVLAIEPPGWGTPPLGDEEYRPSALAGRLVALFDELGLERPVYAGWSWGASIGCYLGLEAPERLLSLVLLDAGYTDIQDTPGFVDRDFESLRSELARHSDTVRYARWEDCVADGRRRLRTWRPALEQRLRESFRLEEGAFVPLVGQDVIAAALDGVRREPPSAAVARLGETELPTLLVAASATLDEEWGAAALERFRLGLPAAHVRTIDSSHDLFSDALEETVELVGSWAAAR